MFCWTYLFSVVAVRRISSSVMESTLAPLVWFGFFSRTSFVIAKRL